LIFFVIVIDLPFVDFYFEILEVSKPDLSESCQQIPHGLKLHSVFILTVFVTGASRKVCMPPNDKSNVFRLTGPYEITHFFPNGLITQRENNNNKC
jgi:hypothetical protein